MKEVIAILRLLLVLRLNLIWSYLFYAKFYPFLFLMLVINSTLTWLFSFVRLLSSLTWQYYLYSKMTLTIYTYEFFLKWILYLVNFSIKNKIRVLLKLFSLSSEFRGAFGVLSSTVLKFRGAFGVLSSTVLKFRGAFGVLSSIVLKFIWILALSFVAVNLLLVYWYLSAYLSVEAIFFNFLSLFKGSLIWVLDASLSEWVRFYENFIFFNEEQYSEKPTGGLFVLFNFFWPLVDYYLNASKILQYLNEMLFFPFYDLFTSLSIYSYYQHIAGELILNTNEQEWGLLFCPSPFHHLNDYFLWSFGVYFKFWWFLVAVFFNFENLYIFILTYFYENLLYLLVLLSEPVLDLTSFVQFWNYLSFFTEVLQNLYINAESLILCGKYFIVSFFVAFFFFLNFVFVFFWKIGFILVLHIGLCLKLCASICAFTVFSEIIFWVWFFSNQFTCYLEGGVVEGAYFILSILRFSITSVLYGFTFPFTMVVAVLKVVAVLIINVLNSVVAGLDALVYFFFSGLLMLCKIAFYPFFLFFSLLQINFLAVLSFWVSLLEYVFLFFNNDVFVFSFSFDSFFWFSAVLYFVLGVFVTFLFAYSKTLYYCYINRSESSDFLTNSFFTKLGLSSRKLFFLTEYEKIRVFDILVGLVYYNLKSLNYVYSVNSSRAGLNSNRNKDISFTSGVFIGRDSKGIFLDLGYSFYTKFIYFIILVERRILLFLGVGAMSHFSNELSRSSTLFNVVFACGLELRNEINSLVALLLDSTVEFVRSKAELTKTSSWLETTSFSFFFMFPWLSATVSYEMLYWIKSSDIWYLQSKWLRYAAFDEQSSLFNVTRYSFNSRVLGEFLTPHLSFPTEQTNMHTLLYKYLKLADLNDISAVRKGRRHYLEAADRDFFFRVAHARSVQFGQFCAWVYIWILDLVFPAETNFEMGGTVLHTKRMRIPHTDEAWYKRFPWLESVRLSVRSFVLGIVLPVIGNLTPVFDIALIYGGDALRRAISMDAGFSLEVLAWGSRATRKKMASSDLRYDILPQMMVHSGVILQKFLRQYTFWWGYSQIFPERMGGKLGRYIHDNRDIPNFLRVFEEVPSFTPTYSEFAEQPFRFFAPFGVEKNRESIYLPVKLSYHPFMTVPTVEYWRKKDYLRVKQASRDFVSPSLLFAYNNDMSAYFLYRRLNSFLSQAHIDSAGFYEELNFSNWDFEKPLYKVLYSELSYKYLAQRQSFVFAISEYEHFHLNRKLALRSLLIKDVEDETFWRKKYGVRELDAWNFQLAVFLDSAKQIMNNEFRVFLDGKLFSFTSPAVQVFFESRYSEFASLIADLVKLPVTSELILWFDFILRFIMYKLSSLYILFYEAQLPLLTHESLILWSAAQREWHFQLMPLVSPFDLEHYMVLNDVKLQLFVFEFDLWAEFGIDSMEFGSLVLITDSVELLD